MSDQAGERSKQLLVEAIDKLDLPTLQSVFKEMCAASEDFRQEASARLLVTEPALKRAAGDEDSGPNKKQKLEDASTAYSRYESCQNCKQVFDVTKNTKKSCRYHEGQLELDPDVFPDDDQVEMDPNSIDVETDDRRRTHPHGFIWDCCDEDCNNKGCIVERHVAAKPFPKRVGIKSAPEIIEIEDDDDEEEDDESE
ncbi:hypothetical protein PG996_006577 [Apiospora saccharicola]|uniref:C2H2-type domain-containing protein n=1 Tax=Apiospora saccharicola TaxID=335842 RepID=A0ABR1V8E7_9PEZI